jgi:hypothetical protein
MRAQSLQRFLFERRKFTDGNRHRDQYEVPVGGEDVSQRIAHEMMLSE